MSAAQAICLPDHPCCCLLLGTAWEDRDPCRRHRTCKLGGPPPAAPQTHSPGKPQPAGARSNMMCGRVLVQCTGDQIKMTFCQEFWKVCAFEGLSRSYFSKFCDNQTKMCCPASPTIQSRCVTQSRHLSMMYRGPILLPMMIRGTICSAGAIRPKVYMLA